MAGVGGRALPGQDSWHAGTASQTASPSTRCLACSLSGVVLHVSMEHRHDIRAHRQLQQPESQTLF